MVVLDEFVEVGIHQWKNTIDETLTRKKMFLYIGMHFIALILLWLLLIMSR